MIVLPDQEKQKGRKITNDHSIDKLLCEMQRVINVSKSRIFPVAYTRLSFSDDPEKILTLEFPMTPRTSSVLLDQGQGSSTQGRGIKILPPKQMLQR